MATDIRPLLTAPSDRWVELPAHEFPVPYAFCVHCGEPQQPSSFLTYEEYVEHFYANEYEGDPGHAPESREDFEYVRDSCLG